MKKGTIKFTFKAVSIEIMAYSIEVLNTVNILEGEYYEGKMSIVFATKNGEKMFTDNVVYSGDIPNGSLEIENGFSGETVFVNDADLINVCADDLGVHSTTMNFRFKKHSKNSL